MATAPSASYSLSLHVRLPEGHVAFSPIIQAIEEAGGVIAAVADLGDNIRDITVLANSITHEHAIAAAVRALRGVEVVRSHRLHLRHARRRENRRDQQSAVAHPRRPVHGLYAGCRARLHGSAR